MKPLDVAIVVMSRLNGTPRLIPHVTSVHAEITPFVFTVAIDFLGSDKDENLVIVGRTKTQEMPIDASIDAVKALVSEGQWRELNREQERENKEILRNSFTLEWRPSEDEA